MTTKREILDAALEQLRQGGTLTIDAVARAAGLTKPGLVHHFATKEVLAIAVVEHLLGKWTLDLQDLAGDETSASARLRAYVEYTLMGDMDSANLALLADTRLRDKLSTLWAARMDTWFGESADPYIVAARLIADGAWIDRSLGIVDHSPAERAAVLDIAFNLIDKRSDI